MLPFRDHSICLTLLHGLAAATAGAVAIFLDAGISAANPPQLLVDSDITAPAQLEMPALEVPSIHDALFEQEPTDAGLSLLLPAAMLQEVQVYPIEMGPEPPGANGILDGASARSIPEPYTGGRYAEIDPNSSPAASNEAARYYGRFRDTVERMQVGIDLYSPPDFSGGLIVYGRNVAMKIGGFVKADFIYDFDPIDSTDSFITTSIPVGAPPRTNSRFHARQTRLSFDTRWIASQHPVRVFVEGDFFSEGDRFRLRHAYGESGDILVGQTWTTFTDVAASPATLDFEGSVSNINRRQAQARYTRNICNENLSMAVSVEDTRFILELPSSVTGLSRSPSPDFVARLRYETDWARYQVAGLFRNVGFQPTGATAVTLGEEILTAGAWGLNWTGVMLVDDQTKIYSKILHGEGIGSYRDLPDAAPTAMDSVGLLPLFAWMVGVTHDWRDDLSSNFTYAENSLSTSMFQDPNGVKETTYLAANLIWTPVERVSVGGEYLFGTRENVDGRTGSANRLQMSLIFDLP